MGLLAILRRLLGAGEPQAKAAELAAQSAPTEVSSSPPPEKMVGFDWSLLDDKVYRAEVERSLAMRLAPNPLPLPPAVIKYILYSLGDGWYDIVDGEDKVGSLRKELSDEEHATVWSLRLKLVEYDFATFKAAKEWLGNPPVRRYQ